VHVARPVATIPCVNVDEVHRHDVGGRVVLLRVDAIVFGFRFVGLAFDREDEGPQHKVWVRTCVKRARREEEEEEGRGGGGKRGETMEEGM